MGVPQMELIKNQPKQKLSTTFDIQSCLGSSPFLTLPQKSMHPVLGSGRLGVLASPDIASSFRRLKEKEDYDPEEEVPAS